VQELEHVVEEKTNQTAQHENSIQDLKQQVQQLEQQLEHVVEEKTNQTAQHENSIQDLTQQVQQLEHALEEKTKLVEENKKVIKENMKEIQSEMEIQINSYKQNIEKLHEKNKQLQNEIATKVKLNDEINTIILKNNAYFEQTNLELFSNNQKIGELNKLNIDLQKELHSKGVELKNVNDELILCRNNYILRQSKPR
jgi:chromosome segregation ATPase